MDILSIRELLQSGASMLYETDTIIGLGCDARSVEGIERVNHLKHRPKNKSYIVMVSNREMLEAIVGKVSELLFETIQFVERPTTFIFPQFKNLPQELSGHGESLAIRWTQNKLLQKFINDIGFPIVSTSANLSGEEAPKTREDVDESILNNVDFILPLSFEGTQQASRIVKIHEDGSFITIRD